MEFPQTRQIEKRRVDDNETVWFNSQGKEIARVEINNETGITFWIKGDVIPRIEDQMSDFNTESIFLNEKLKTDSEEERAYFIRPGHNWNCAKRDFLTVVDHWLNPPIFTKIQKE